MIVSMLLAGSLVVEAPAVREQPFPMSDLEHVDVAYEQMIAGRTDEAIARIEANERLRSDDPAALINLGTAYARKGMRREAMDCFEAAMASDQRFELQLADGSWMDSRRAAHVAAARLDSAGTLAARR